MKNYIKPEVERFFVEGSYTVLSASYNYNVNDIKLSSTEKDNDQALSRQASSIWDDDETDRNTDDVIPW